MQTTKRLPSPVYEKDFPVKKYLGRNSFGEHSALSANESRELVNWDLFAGEDEDFIKSRRGSQFLRPSSAPTKRGSTDIVDGVPWDIGAEEYLITQEGTSFYSQALVVNPGNPVLIADVSGAAFTLGSSVRADLVLSGDRLRVFHPAGNKIIEWDSAVGAFKGRPMGMTFPYILAVTSANAGAISGSYTLAVEKCYFSAVGERLASTPNRMTTGRILAVTGAITAKKIKATIQATELDNDTLWTHLRFLRSKNKNVDVSDPLNPIDAQGIDSEVYEEALITRAEMGAGALASVATGATLPVGNAGTQAGKPGGVYTIEVNNADSVLFDLLGIDQIELLPMPAAAVGCFHGKKIFVSAINDSTLDDQSRSNIYYSSFADTKYSEQYNPLNFIDTGRDGEQMIRLFSFEKDLIGIKEAKTGRLPGGNVDLEFETLDHRIGISNARMASYIAAVGICAITNDDGDFRIFGYDLRWSKTIHSIDISKPIRVETSEFAADYVSFFYVNGKLLISDGTGNVYALHEKEKRGWTVYQYRMNSLAQLAFTFSNGSRAAIASKSTYLMEIEVSGIDTDDSTADDTLANLVELSETTYRFQSGKGRHILEHAYLEILAALSVKLTAVPYVNGLPWPLQTSDTETDFAPDPAIYTTMSALKDGAYRLYLSPAAIGSFLWNRMMGNYLHYVLTTTAPALMRRKVLRSIVDEDGISFGNFDPFQAASVEATEPGFAQNIIDGGVDDETITDEIDGGVDDETITDEIDAGVE
jgi:hypothetical protein